jgi:hypothetical protein
VDEPDLAALEREEGPVGGDPRDGPVHDRPDLDLRQRLLLDVPLRRTCRKSGQSPIGLFGASI